MHLARRLAIFVLLVAACGQAAAQFGGKRRGGTDSDDRRSRQSPGGESSEVTRLSASDLIRMNLTNTRMTLKLSPEQDIAWRPYEAKVLDLLSDLSRGFNAPGGEDAIRQIDRRVDLARNRLTAMEDLSDAARKFYATLSKEQKAVADQMIPGTVPALYAGAAPPTAARG